ncbi:tail fiber domain-containing protein (plasmid) [Xenorhabdus stockiae]|uniref:tail fiber domain-containing protein n=1 Tax=Xenorhabdus stockiae TaxID=351614 RepID=UPI003CF2FE30
MSQVINEATVLSSNRDALPLLADIQYLEPYTSSALNRKFKGILRAGIYTGFQPKAGTGLSVLITSSSEQDGQGAASINVGKNQISIQQVKEVIVPVPASKTSIIALEANFEFGKVTNQVDSASTIKAAHIVVVDVSQGISGNQLELCRVNVPMDAKAVTEAMIDTSHRVVQTVGITLSEKIDSDEENLAANAKAVNLLRKTLLDNTNTRANDALTAANNANNNANGRVPAGRKVNGKSLSGDIALNAADVGAYSKGETYSRGEVDSRVNDVRNVANNANNNANGRVPAGRKVNGKPLSGDIALNAADVGAYSKGETYNRGEVDSRVNDVRNVANSANTNANGRVPSGRKVNGKPLSADITLNAAEVGAYSKVESDGKYQTKIGQYISFGETNKAWTTAQFIDFLKSQGAFNTGYWLVRGTWWYAGNSHITDTGVGNIHLAGCTVEVVGLIGAYTIKIITPTTSASGEVNKEFIYVHNGNGNDYSPGWRRLYNTSSPPTAAEVGAYSKDETNQNFVKSDTTNLGKSWTSLTTIPDGGWAKPIGYSTMVHINSVGLPNGFSDHGYWHVVAARDMAQGYAGFLTSFNNRKVYYGFSNTKEGNPTWVKVYTDSHKPSPSELDVYSKGESDGKYQLKGNFANKGESYTKGESDGKYQPKGSFANKGESYTKGESDGRYLGKSGGEIFGDLTLQKNARRHIRFHNGAKVDGYIYKDPDGHMMFNNGVHGGDWQMRTDGSFYCGGHGNFSGEVRAPSLITGAVNNQSYFFQHEGVWRWTVQQGGTWKGEIQHPGRGGVFALQGDSYTKGESDNKYQLKGNFANKGDSYSKPESDGRHYSSLKYVIRKSGGDNTDLDNWPINRVAFIYGDATNSPNITGVGASFSALNKNYVLQITSQYSGNGDTLNFRTRNGDAGKWNPWYQVATTGWTYSRGDIDSKVNGRMANGTAYTKNESDGKYQLKGNFANKGESYTKGESDGKYQPKGNFANKGESYTKGESDGKYQPKGNFANKGESYTKGESDGKYQPKGNFANKGESYTKGESDGKYQPKGNFANKGESYTKGESDGKYQPKGNFANKGESYTKGESDGRYFGKSGGEISGNLTLKNAARRHIIFNNGAKVDGYIYKDADGHMMFNNGVHGGDWQMQIDGTFYCGGNGNFNDVYIRSDKRAKKDIEKIINASEKLSKLSGYTYTISDDNNNSSRSAGLIAQQVQKVLPEAVTQDENDLLRLNYNSVIGLLVEAVKELKQEVAYLKKELP